MSWKVYGATAGNSYSRDAGGEVYGPLPCKRWIRDIPHKRHKVKHRIIPATTDIRDKDWKRRDDEKRAIQYAHWLAARDGKTLPALKCRAEWSGVYSAYETRNVHHWNGTRTQARYLPRIRSVTWGSEAEVYSTRKNGQRGAFLYKQWEAEFTIELPHWDWEPAEPVKTFVEEMAA